MGLFNKKRQDPQELTDEGVAHLQAGDEKSALAAFNAQSHRPEPL